MRPATILARVIAPAFIPSPSANGFHIGPLFFHAYGIAYVFAVPRRSRHAPALGAGRGIASSSSEVALWAFPAG